MIKWLIDKWDMWNEQYLIRKAQRQFDKALEEYVDKLDKTQ